MRLKPLLLSIVVAGLLSGCASNPELRNQERLDIDNIEEDARKRAENLERVWSTNEPAITYLSRENNVFVEPINPIPSSISDKTISGLTLRPGATLRDLSGVLYPYKVNIMFDESQNKSPVQSGGSDAPESSGDIPLADLPFSIKKFTGTVGELLEMVEKLYNVSFEHIGGQTLKATASARYIASFPQVENVLDSIKENISSLGGMDVKTNILAGSVVYEASAREQQEIERFLERFYENFAGVKFQITVYSVALDETVADGFDWSSLDVVLGHVEAAYAGGPIRTMLNALEGNGQEGQNGQNQNNNNNNNNNNNSSGNDGQDDLPNFDYNDRYSGSNVDDLRSFAWFNKDALDFGAYNKNLSVSVATQWMNQYGNTRAEQSAFTETITGKETTISSLRQVPVIDEESTTLVGNLSPVATQNTSTSEEQVGMKITFTPFYDASAQEMIIDLDVSLKSIVGTRTLTSSNGNQFQKFEVQEESFPTTVRMKVGETRLLGGVIYETLSEDRSNPNLFETEEFIKQTKQKSAMFVMISPSVQLFSQPGSVK